MSEAGKFRDESSIQAVDFWDRLRAARSTPDVPTFQDKGFFGLGTKVAANLASLPLDLLDAVKSVPTIAPTVGAAMNPQGALARMQLGNMMLNMGTGMVKGALENPTTTAASFAAPGAGYNLVREAAYATLGAKAPHAMMYIRSMLPWYEGKPWTRVPEGVSKVVQKTPDAFTAATHLDISASNVADKLRPYLASRGEEPLAPMSHAEYNAAYTEWLLKSQNFNEPRPRPQLRIPYGHIDPLNEVVGGTFVDRQPGSVRILDDLRWYLDTEIKRDPASGAIAYGEASQGLSPYTPQELSEILQKAYANPKDILPSLKALLKPSTSIVGGGHTPLFARDRLRDTLELLVKRFGHSYPIDWNIPLPPPE